MFSALYIVIALEFVTDDMGVARAFWLRCNLCRSNPGMITYVTDPTSIATAGQTCVGSSSNNALVF
jgi:hypothetical protein